jgi:hypothetical protein
VCGWATARAAGSPNRNNIMFCEIANVRSVEPQICWVSCHTNESDVKHLEEERGDFLSQNFPAVIFILSVNRA